MEPAAPKVAGCKDLAASRLAAANPSCVGVRLMCNSREREAAQNKNGRETASGQDQQYGARLRLSPKTTAITRATSSGQDVGNSRGDGQPSRHFAGCVCETGRPRWTNQF